MSERKVHLPLRVHSSIIERLDAIATQRRMETGELVSRADIAREALERYIATPEPGALSDGGEDFGKLFLDTIEMLEREHRRLDIEHPQDFGMAIWPYEHDPRLKRLMPFLRKVRGVIDSL